MKVFIAFLLLSFVMGGREVRLQRPARLIVVFGLAVVVAFALRSYRFV